MSEQVILAFALTLGAGLATGIGSAIAFFAHHTDRKFLSFTLGLSAGVMLYVSFAELLSDARFEFIEIFGEDKGQLWCAVSFFAGIALAALIDRIVPERENPHEMRSVELMDHKLPASQKMVKAGIVTAIAIGVHNFPEGVATFMATMSDTTVGVPIAIAVAIHNIPEGIAVAVPIYFATNSRAKAFKYSFLSGLSEPVGALAAWLILMPMMTQTLLNVVFAVVAGIMVYISIDELLPSAEEYGQHHLSILGVIIGMALMAASLILL